jgi:hypothetical protein
VVVVEAIASWNRPLRFAKFSAVTVALAVMTVSPASKADIEPVTGKASTACRVTVLVVYISSSSCKLLLVAVFSTQTFTFTTAVTSEREAKLEVVYARITSRAALESRV